MLRKHPTRLEMKSDNDDMADYERVREKKYAEQKQKQPDFKPPTEVQLTTSQRIGMTKINK